MNFLQKMRDDMGFKLLKRTVKKLKHQRTFNNLSSASSVGILCDTFAEESFLATVSFAEDLVKSGLKVTILGYVLNESMANYLPKKEGFSVFSRPIVNWLGYPKEASVSNFVSEEFDILINLSTRSEELCINYSMGMSKAKLRVSPKLKSDMFADFILQLSQETVRDTQKLINCIKEYLSAFSKA